MKAMPDLMSKTINQIVNDSMNPTIMVKNDGLLSNYQHVVTHLYKTTWMNSPTDSSDDILEINLSVG